jgi:hypothetical protein
MAIRKRKEIDNISGTEIIKHLLSEIRTERKKKDLIMNVLAVIISVVSLIIVILKG